MGFGGAIKAFAFVIFGVITLYLGWYMIPVIANVLPSNALKIVFWVGIIEIFVLCFLVTPYLTITGKIDSLKGALKGFLAFAIGTMVTTIANFIVPNLIDVMGNVFSFNVAGQIIWVGMFGLGILTMIILPAYFTIREYLESKEDGNQHNI